MIHDLGNDNRADAGIGVGRVEGVGALQNEMVVGQAVPVASEADPVGGGFEIPTVIVAGQIGAGVHGEEIGGFAELREQEGV